MSKIAGFKARGKQGHAGLWVLALVVAFAIVGMMTTSAMATVYLPTAADKTAFDQILDSDADDGGVGTHQTVTEVNDSLTGDAATFRVAIRPIIGWKSTTTFQCVIYDTADDGDNTGDNPTVGSVDFLFYDASGTLVATETVDSADFDSGPDQSDYTGDGNYDAVSFTVTMPEPLGSPTKYLIRFNDVTDAAGNTIAHITFPDASLTRFYSLDATTPAVSKVGVSADPSTTVYVIFDRDVFDPINDGTGEMIASSEEADISEDKSVGNSNPTTAPDPTAFGIQGGANPTAAAQMGGQSKVVELTFASAVAAGATLNWSGSTDVKDLAGRTLEGGSAPVELLEAPQITDVSQDSATQFTLTFDNTMSTAGSGWYLVDLDDNNSTISQVNGVNLTVTPSIANGKVVLELNQAINTDGTIWATASGGGFSYATKYSEAAVQHRVGVMNAGTAPRDIFNTPADIVGEANEVTTDNAPPVYVYAGTTDADLNGQIDGIVVYLSEPVNATGLSSDDFLAQETESATPTDLTLGTIGTVANSFKFVIPFTETSNLTGGTAETDIQFKLNDTSGHEAAFTITDASGNDSEVDLGATPVVNEPSFPTAYSGVEDTTGPVITGATVNEDGTTIDLTLSENSNISGAYYAQRMFVITTATGEKVEFEGSTVSGSGTAFSFDITSSSEKVVPGDKIYIYTYPTNNTAAVADANGWPRISTQAAPFELTAPAAVVATPTFDKAVASDTNGDGFFDKIVITIDDGDGNPVNLALKRVDTDGETVTNATAADFANSFLVYNSAFNEEVGSTIVVTNNTIELTLTHPSQVAGPLSVRYDPTMNLNNAQIVNSAASDDDLLAGDGVLAGFDKTTGALDTADDIAIVDQDFDGYVDGVMMTFNGIELQDTTSTDGITLQYWDEANEQWVDVPITSLVVENEKDDEGNPVKAYVTVSFDETLHKMLTDDTTHLKIFYAGSQLVTADGDQIGVFGQDGQTSAFTDKAAPAIIKAEYADGVLTLTMSENVQSFPTQYARNFLVFTNGDGYISSLEDSDASIERLAAGNAFSVSYLPFDPVGLYVKFYNARSANPVIDGEGNVTKTTAEVQVKGVIAFDNAYGQKDSFGFYDRVVITAGEALEIVPAVGEGKDITDAFVVVFNYDIEEHPTAVTVDDEGNLVLTLKTRLSIANDEDNTRVKYSAPTDIDDDDTANDSAYVRGASSGKAAGNANLVIEFKPPKADSVNGGYSPFLLNLHGKLLNFPSGPIKINAYLAKVMQTVRPVDWTLTYKGITVNSKVYEELWGNWEFWPSDMFEILDFFSSVRQNSEYWSRWHSVFYLHTDGDGNGLVGDYRIVRNGPEATSDNAGASSSGNDAQDTDTWKDTDMDGNWDEYTHQELSGGYRNFVSDESADEVVQLQIDWHTGVITAKGQKIGKITLVQEPKLYLVGACGSEYLNNPKRDGATLAEEGSTGLEYSMVVYGSSAAAHYGDFCVLLVAELADGSKVLLSSINPADKDAYIPFAPQFETDSGITEYDVDYKNISSVYVSNAACDGWNLVPVAVEKVYASSKGVSLPTLPSWASASDAKLVPDLRRLFVGLGEGVPELFGYTAIVSLDNLGTNYQVSIGGEVTGDLKYVVGGYGYMVKIPTSGSIFFFGPPLDGTLTVKRVTKKGSENYGWNLVVGTSNLSGFDYAIGFNPYLGAVLDDGPQSLSPSAAWLLHLESGTDEATLTYPYQEP